MAGGNGAHSEGSFTKALGDSSHAEGATTQALGDGSHSQGQNTIASGQNSHAEGDATQSIGYASHAEGNSTIAGGNNSHAEGYQTEVFPGSLGQFSHAQGAYTIAGNFGSHASGYGGGGSIDGIVATGITSFAHFNIAEGTGLGYRGAQQDYSAILGGRDHDITNNGNDSVIIGGQWNKIDSDSSTYNSIVGGLFNSISGETGTGQDMNYCSIIGGQTNVIRGSASGGADHSGIFSSKSSLIESRDGSYNTIIGGLSNSIISNNDGNTIIGGKDHSIGQSSYSAIIGGDNNDMDGFSRSVIIGGQNITATSADTVFMPNVDLCQFGGVLHVSTVIPCSPLTISPGNEGNVHIGDQGGAPIITLDILTPDEPGIYFGEESFIRWKENEQKLIIGEEEAGGKVVIEVEGDEILDVEKEKTKLIEGDFETEAGNIIVKSGSGKTVIIEDYPDVAGANLGTNIDGELIDVPSDSRVKNVTNELPLVVDPLEFLSHVKAYQFKWKPETRIGDPNKLHYGFKVDDFRDDLIYSTGQNLNADQKNINEVAKSMVEKTKRKFMFGNNTQPEHVDKMNYEDLIPFMIEGIKSLNVNMTNLSSVSSGGAKKYVQIHTLTKGNTETITHNLNEADVIVQLLSESGEMVIPDRVSTYLPNSVDIDVSVTSNYKIIIMG